MTTPSQPLHFYDILMRPPLEQTLMSPNPWKTRFALNFKRLPYTSTFLPLLSIASLRRSLSLPAARKFADGSDYHTLPVLVDPNTAARAGDSLDIAVYLQHTYPLAGAGDLFPADVTLDFATAASYYPLVPLSELRAGEYPRYADWNQNVDAAFTAHVQLTVAGIPFAPEEEAANKAEFCRRAGKERFEEFEMTQEERESTMRGVKETLRDLARVYAREDGPYVRGAEACYADFVVGGWLRMFAVCLPEGEWGEVRGWYGGVFGRLYDALMREFGEVRLE